MVYMCVATAFFTVVGLVRCHAVTYARRMSSLVAQGVL